MTATERATSLSDRAIAAYEQMQQEAAEQAALQRSIAATLLAREACEVTRRVLDVMLPPEAISIRPAGEQPQFATFAIDGIEFAVMRGPLFDGDDSHAKLRLRVPCPRGCGELVLGPQVECFTDLGRHLAEPPDGDPCDACRAGELDGEDF